MGQNRSLWYRLVLVILNSIIILLTVFPPELLPATITRRASISSSLALAITWNSKYSEARIPKLFTHCKPSHESSSPVGKGNSGALRECQWQRHPPGTSTYSLQSMLTTTVSAFTHNALQSPSSPSRSPSVHPPPWILFNLGQRTSLFNPKVTHTTPMPDIFLLQRSVYKFLIWCVIHQRLA